VYPTSLAMNERLYLTRPYESKTSGHVVPLTDLIDLSL